MKRQKPSGELRRTAEKIKQYIVNPASDGADRILSATATQARIAFDVEALEIQPSNAGRHRKGYKGPLRRAIERICGQFVKPDLESILQVLEDGDAIEDMYESLSDPIDIHAVEVLRNGEKIQFSLRNGDEKTASLKTLRNLISNYKSSHPD